MPADVQTIRGVLYFTYSDPLTLADIEKSLEVYAPLLSEAIVLVHSIFDATHLTLLPRNVLSTFMAKRLDYEPMLIHPMRGVSIIVTGSSLIISVACIAAKAFSSPKVQVVRSMDQAWAAIDHYGVRC